MCGELFDAVGGGLGGAEIDEDAGFAVLDDVVEAGVVVKDWDAAGGHAFHGGDAEAFVLGGGDEKLGAAVFFDELMLFDFADEGGLALDVEGSGEGFETLAKARPI